MGLGIILLAIFLEAVILFGCIFQGAFITIKEITEEIRNNK